MSAYVKNTERPQINDLLLYLKLLQKQEQAKPKTSGRKIIKTRVKISGLDIKNIQRINETKLFL
jgi:hypothetical protein